MTDLARFLSWLKDQRSRMDDVGDLAREVGDQAPHRALWRSIGDLRRHLRWCGTLGATPALVRALAEFNAAAPADLLQRMGKAQRSPPLCGAGGVPS